MISYQEIHNARRKLEKLQEQYLKERGWEEGFDYLWSKGDHNLLNDDEAVHVERTYFSERS